MASSPAAAFLTADPNNPFTRELLRSLTGTLRAQADETNAEYEERFTAAATVWATFRPRDPMEQMLAAHIVAAQYAGLDCLNWAMEVDGSAQADRLRRSYGATMRTMRDTMHLLAQQRMQPEEEAAPLPVIESIPPRRRPSEAKPAQQAMHREKPPAAPAKDPAAPADDPAAPADDPAAPADDPAAPADDPAAPAKDPAAPAKPPAAPAKPPTEMTDEQLEAARSDIHIQCAIALFDVKHPLHQDALEILPELLPEGMVVTGRSHAARYPAG